MSNDIIGIVVTDNSDNVQLNVTPNLVTINVSQTSGNIIGSNYFLANNYAALPATGESTTLYITNDTSLMYRWSVSAYVQVNSVTSWGTIAGTLSSQTDLQNALNLKAPLASPAFTGTVTGVTKTMVGLSNVDNTSDVNKPVSTATQTALDLKSNINNPTFTGTVGGVTKAMVGLGNVDNTTDLNKPISTATQSSLDTKAPIASPTFTGTVSGITKSMVGLENVDNTTDLLKPISTATQTALNLKYDASNPSGYTTNVGTVTSVGGTGTVSGLSLSGSVTTSGNLTLGGTLSLTSGNVTGALGFTPENAAIKGIANGYASLDGGGLVPSTQLPSYVDDVLEFANLAALPATGETGKIYVTLDTNKIYRWSGATYIEVSPTVGTIWGGITGTLANQTDLQNALNAKQASLTGTGFVVSTSGTITYDTSTYYLASNPNSYIALTALSSTATGLTYTNTTGVFSLTAGYAIPTTASATNWDTAYTNRITSLTVTGSSGASTLVSNVLNIPTYTLSGLGGQVALNGTGFVKISGTTISYDNSTYLTTASASSTYQTIITNPITGTGTINELAYFTASGTIASLPVATYPSLTELSYVKGVTSAIQTQINTKQATVSLTTTGTSGAATFSSNTLNIPNYGSALSGYLPLTGGTLTGALGGTTATFSGLVTLNSNEPLILNRTNNTSTSNAIRFQTGGTTQWYVGSDSYLQSGTENFGFFNGAYRLVITPTGAATFSSSVQTGGDISLMNSTGDISLKFKDSGGNADRVLTRQITTNNVYIGDIDANGGAAIIRANGNDAITITSAGNVGIGVTPSSSINSGVSKVLSISNTSQYASLVIQGRNGGEAGITIADDLYIDIAGNSTGTNNNILFRTTNTNSSYSTTERMRITSGGNVNINGSGFSDVKFYVKGSDATSSNYAALFVNGNATNLFNIRNDGAVQVFGSLSKGSGSFRIKHPLISKKSTHQLVHSFIEGPQADLIYRGKIRLSAGKAIINIDVVSTMTEGTFEALCREVQCFTTNETGWDAVRGKVIGNILTIESQNIESTDEISWMVVGERQDEHIMDTEWTDEQGKVIVEPLKA